MLLRGNVCIEFGSLTLPQSTVQPAIAVNCTNTSRGLLLRSSGFQGDCQRCGAQAFLQLVPLYMTVGLLGDGKGLRANPTVGEISGTLADITVGIAKLTSCY